MAKFEPYDSDDILADADMFETECPECGKELSFSLDKIGSKITCPHCNTEVIISSE